MNIHYLLNDELPSMLDAVGRSNVGHHPIMIINM